MGVSKASYSAMTDAELAVLARVSDNGAFNELALRYIDLISHIAHRYSAQGYEQKDFVQEGLLALMSACGGYDSGREVSFKTYLSVSVERRFISIIRRDSSKKAVPASALVNLDGLGDSFADTSLSPEEAVLGEERLELLKEKLCGMLSKREYEVLMLYTNGLGYSAIAERLMMTEKSVDNALQRARRKVKARISPR